VAAAVGLALLFAGGEGGFTACGLWFGITAPDVSPVAPPVGPGVEAPAFPVVTTGDAP